MFSRNFMKVFPIRKYGQYTAKTGSISSDIWLTNQKQIRIGRFLIYTIVGAVMLNAFINFHTADEIIGQSPRPLAYTFYERWVPQQILIPNLSIIEGFEAIEKTRQLKETLTFEK